ncbi:MAG: PHP domain-containing protein [Candidatus Omnitrophica bacterium]|nr:PHP domain-containing protein [Candidatus Omnitrophota bacterium]
MDKNKLLQKCDLHIHSVFSDSDATIEEIFKIAKEKNLSAIAITDHDTVDGLEEARKASETYGIELVEGIELSAQKNDIEIHVLGYFLNSRDENLKKELFDIRILRQERLIKMIDKLKALGLRLSSDEILLKTKNAIPTRLHLALYLIQKGYAKSVAQAFGKYLSPGKPGYMARFKYSVEEAVQLIKKYGGLAFLAHPNAIPDQSWIEEFVSLGIDGLEVIYPRFSDAKKLMYKNMADKFGILKSGGSDAHGSYRDFTKIGDVTIPYEWLLAMKKKKGI